MVLVKGKKFGLRKISDTNLSKSQIPLDNIKILLIKRSNSELRKSYCGFLNRAVLSPPLKNSQSVLVSCRPNTCRLARLPHGKTVHETWNWKGTKPNAIWTNCQLKCFYKSWCHFGVWVERLASPDQIPCQTSTRSSRGSPSQVKEVVFDPNSLIFLVQWVQRLPDLHQTHSAFKCL